MSGFRPRVRPWVGVNVPGGGPWEVTGTVHRTDVLGFHSESQPRAGGAIEGPGEQGIETQRSGEGW